MKSNRWLFFPGLLALACYCTQESRKEILIADVPIHSTNRRLPAEIQYENSDTSSMVRLDVLIRLQNQLPSGLPLDLVVETVTPDSHIWRDSLSVPYRQTDRTETRSLSYTDIKFPYRSNNRLSKPGIYRFRFHSLMPDSIHRHWLGVGLEISTQ